MNKRFCILILASGLLIASFGCKKEAIRAEFDSPEYFQQYLVQQIKDCNFAAIGNIVKGELKIFLRHRHSAVVATKRELLDTSTKKHKLLRVSLCGESGDDLPFGLPLRYSASFILKNGFLDGRKYFEKHNAYSYFYKYYNPEHPPGLQDETAGIFSFSFDKVQGGYKLDYLEIE